MLFRFFFRQIADSWVLMVLSWIVLGVSLLGMHQRSQPLVSVLSSPAGGSTPQPQSLPDTRFSGYTVNELHAFYDHLGFEGCRIYIAVENWDIFPFMVSYTLCLGSWLTILARNMYPNDRGDSISFIAVIIWMLDMIETVIQRQGCRIYPDRLPDSNILLASAAVQLKWKLVLLSLCVLGIGTVRVVVWQRMNHGSTAAAATNKSKQK